jgi:hypothetical protein
MFKKNTAITGFQIGHFINATTGAAVTTGTPTCKRTLDGTGGACANAAAYNTNGAAWGIDLAAGDMNGDLVGLSFTLTDCLPISYTIRTSTKLVSDLQDPTVASIQSGLATPTNITAASGVTLAAATHTGAIIPTVSAVTAISTGGIAAASFVAGAIDAAAIADNAIDNATFAADVGSTAIAQNKIGLACDKSVIKQIATDTMAEVGVAAPTATPTIEEILRYLYFFWRNKTTSTDAVVSMYQDDGLTVACKANIADAAGTFTKDEYISG